MLVLFLILFCALASSASAQSDHITLFISAGVFDRDPTIKAIIDTWEAYLNSHPDSSYNNPLWNDEEKDRYPGMDLLNVEFNPSLYAMMQTYRPTLLSVKPEGEFYKVKTLFAGIQDSTSIAPIAITEVYAKHTDAGWKFYNALPINTREWEHTTLRSVTFIYPKTHVFNAALAKKLVAFVDTVARNVAVPLVHVDYYLDDDYDELKHAMGFNFVAGEGNAREPAGKADAVNHIVYGAGQGEFFAHEFVHIYINPKYPDADWYFHEGLSTLLGGSRGRSLDWHIVHADSLLAADTSLHLDSMMNHVWSENLDYITGSDYLIGGVLCKLLMENGGWPLVLKFGEMKGNGEARFRALKELLGVEQKDAPAFIGHKIHEDALAIRRHQTKPK